MTGPLFKFDGPLLETKFPEAKPLYSKAEAKMEASRCLYCYDAPCSRACPASIDVALFIKQIAGDNVKGSAKTILSENMLGDSCSQVCPVDVLCSGACVLNELNVAPIKIGRLQKFATHTALTEEAATGKKLFEAKPRTGKRVALIGAGPASLSCAAHLTLAGVEAVIYEAGSYAGGLNVTGIAPYKLRTPEALAEVNWILNHGVTLHTGVAIGKDISFSALQEEYDAVFIGIGLGPDHRILEGESCQGIWGATELIRCMKTVADFRLPANIKHTVVIGGGNTAIDIARELAMLGTAGDVSMVYRRTEDEMPGYTHEMEGARKYGVRFMENFTPKKAQIKDGKVVSVTFMPRYGGDEVHLPCDLVVEAIGQKKWDTTLDAAIDFEENGTIKVNPTTRVTTLRNVYAGGDCINGGKEVVNAAADGKAAASAMLAEMRRSKNHG